MLLLSTRASKRREKEAADRLAERESRLENQGLRVQFDGQFDKAQLRDSADGDFRSEHDSLIEPGESNEVIHLRGQSM